MFGKFWPLTEMNARTYMYGLHMYANRLVHCHAHLIPALSSYANIFCECSCSFHYNISFTNSQHTTCITLGIPVSLKKSKLYLQYLNTNLWCSLQSAEMQTKGDYFVSSCSPRETTSLTMSLRLNTQLFTFPASNGKALPRISDNMDNFITNYLIFNSST